MSIEWPNLSLGTGGTSYTSPNLDTWEWKGYAWHASANTYRGFPTPWVIFNSLGNVPTYYPTLHAAMGAAVAGDTIHLFGNVIETMVGTQLKDKVDINLNGHQLTYGGTETGNGLSNQLGQVITCRISNGIIARQKNSSTPTYKLINSDVPGSHIIFENVTIKGNGFDGGWFRCNVTGGNFESYGNYAFRFFTIADSSKNIINVKNVFTKGPFYINVPIGQTINSTWRFQNIVSFDETGGVFGAIQADQSGSANGITLDDCVGIKARPMSESLSSLNAGMYILGNNNSDDTFCTINNSYGISRHVGMFLTRCTVVGSGAEGWQRSFFITGSRLINCGDTGKGLADKSEGYTLIGGLDYSPHVSVEFQGLNKFGSILNSAFSRGIQMSLANTSSSPLLHLHIKNSTIGANSPGPAIKINDRIDNVILNISNNVFGSNKLTGSTVETLSLSGATGSRISKNTIYSSGTPPYYYTQTIPGINRYPMEVSANVCLGGTSAFSNIAPFPADSVLYMKQKISGAISDTRGNQRYPI